MSLDGMKGELVAAVQEEARVLSCAFLNAILGEEFVDKFTIRHVYLGDDSERLAIACDFSDDEVCEGAKTVLKKSEDVVEVIGGEVAIIIVDRGVFNLKVKEVLGRWLRPTRLEERVKRAMAEGPDSEVIAHTLSKVGDESLFEEPGQEEGAGTGVVEEVLGDVKVAVGELEEDDDVEFYGDDFSNIPGNI